MTFTLPSSPKTSSPKGLYLHIPFCQVKCHYCNFVITLDQSERMRERFFAALEFEAAEASRRFGKLQFETFYWGGGTPSVLRAEEMKRIFLKIRELFQFSETPEITLEMNPGDVSKEKITACRNLGVNRASVGAQAFQDSLLEKMGRPHRAEAIGQTFSLLREQGFENISLDLIFRLPGQTLEDFQASLHDALALSPAQVTLYDLEVHEKTRFGILQKEGCLALPDEELHFRMFELAVKTLESAGYRHYELLSFAKPGFESRHNQLYWDNQEYLGLGPGAFSYMNGVRYQFAKDVPQYLKKCETGDWTPDVLDVLTDEQKEMETLLTGLRLDRGIDLHRIPGLRDALASGFRELEEAGLLESRESRIRLTFKGRALAESVFSFLVSLHADLSEKSGGL